MLAATLFASIASVALFSGSAAATGCSYGCDVVVPLFDQTPSNSATTCVVDPTDDTKLELSYLMCPCVEEEHSLYINYTDAAGRSLSSKNINRVYLPANVEATVAFQFDVANTAIKAGSPVTARNSAQGTCTLEYASLTYIQSQQVTKAYVQSTTSVVVTSTSVLTSFTTSTSVVSSTLSQSTAQTPCPGETTVVQGPVRTETSTVNTVAPASTITATVTSVNTEKQTTTTVITIPQITSTKACTTGTCTKTARPFTSTKTVTKTPCVSTSVVTVSTEKTTTSWATCQITDSPKPVTETCTRGTVTECGPTRTVSTIKTEYLPACTSTVLRTTTQTVQASCLPAPYHRRPSRDERLALLVRDDVDGYDAPNCCGVTTTTYTTGCTTLVSTATSVSTLPATTVVTTTTAVTPSPATITTCAFFPVTSTTTPVSTTIVYSATSTPTVYATTTAVQYQTQYFTETSTSLPAPPTTTVCSNVEAYSTVTPTTVSVVTTTLKRTTVTETRTADTTKTVYSDTTLHVPGHGPTKTVCKPWVYATVTNRPVRTICSTVTKKAPETTITKTVGVVTTVYPPHATECGCKKSPPPPPAETCGKLKPHYVGRH